MIMRHREITLTQPFFRCSERKIDQSIVIDHHRDLKRRISEKLRFVLATPKTPVGTNERERDVQRRIAYNVDWSFGIVSLDTCQTVPQQLTTMLSRGQNEKPCPLPQIAPLIR